MVRRWSVVGSCVAVLLSLPATASAQVPTRIPVQGQLTDAEGNAIEGVVQVRVRLYDSLSASAELFSETQDVTVREGDFTFLLGDTEPLDLSIFAEGRPLYIGIAVGDDPEMTPRLPLGTVPYAALAEMAADAATLQGQGPAAFTYSAGSGLSQSGTTFSVDPSTVQSRVTGTCEPGSTIRSIASDGTVTCEPDDDTVYTAGSGVSLSGTNELSADTSYVQRRVAATCVAGSSIRAISENGSVQCENRYTDAEAVAAVSGADLTVNGTVGAAAFDASTGFDEDRILNTYPRGVSWQTGRGGSAPAGTLCRYGIVQTMYFGGCRSRQICYERDGSIHSRYLASHCADDGPWGAWVRVGPTP